MKIHLDLISATDGALLGVVKVDETLYRQAQQGNILLRDHAVSVFESLVPGAADVPAQAADPLSFHAGCQQPYAV